MPVKQKREILPRKLEVERERQVTQDLENERERERQRHETGVFSSFFGEKYLIDRNDRKWC